MTRPTMPAGVCNTLPPTRVVGERPARGAVEGLEPPFDGPERGRQGERDHIIVGPTDLLVDRARDLEPAKPQVRHPPPELLAGAAEGQALRPGAFRLVGPGEQRTAPKNYA